ncbi:Bifunctional inhibitor/plant lipid transfer protein/seed storage helical domain [Macleaya cordata]|uniref:Bifunctional inhibitor/plant lipid transfer protein/seed storage helical domain n=1 Tax=Macleaya cordata TaxID=56857 RepID=A0A200PTI1_MACCD|nr:Bifunctional inhibitor/plant lipid transfer protein/seed storage helical domain [Macleaya cordata]
MAAVFNIRCLGFAVLIVVVGVLTSRDNGVSCQQQGCEGDIQGLISQCAQYVLKEGPKTPPSQGCCDVVKKADVPCICQHVTPAIEALVSVEKVIYVADYCGKALPRGTKCGSKH